MAILPWGRELVAQVPARPAARAPAAASSAAAAGADTIAFTESREACMPFYPEKRVPLDANPATAHMFIMKPFSGAGMMALFSTHPKTEDRIRALLGGILAAVIVGAPVGTAFAVGVPFVPGGLSDFVGLDHRRRAARLKR